MSSFDKVKMEFPNGDTFVGKGNLTVVENQQPFYLVDGFKTIRALASMANVTDGTSSVFLGDGARVRSWQIEFLQWEGSTDAWGSASADDDVITKLNVLGQSLSNAGIDGTSPATLTYGEYSPDGMFSPKSVVPGPVKLPTEFGNEGSPSTFRPSLEWRDAEDLSNAPHPAP
jgi:hypothetical protein